MRNEEPPRRWLFPEESRGGQHVRVSARRPMTFADHMEAARIFAVAHRGGRHPFEGPLNAEDLEWLTTTIEDLTENLRIRWRVPELWPAPENEQRELLCELRQLVEREIVRLSEPMLIRIETDHDADFAPRDAADSALFRRPTNEQMQEQARALMTEVEIDNLPPNRRGYPVCLKDFGTSTDGVPANHPVSPPCSHVLGHLCAELFLTSRDLDRFCPICRRGLGLARQTNLQIWYSVTEMFERQAYTSVARDESQAQNPQPPTPWWLAALQGNQSQAENRQPPTPWWHAAPEGDENNP